MDLGRELVIALVERGAHLLEHVGSAIKGNQGQSREIKGNQGQSREIAPAAPSCVRCSAAPWQSQGRTARPCPASPCRRHRPAHERRDLGVRRAFADAIPTFNLGAVSHLDELRIFGRGQDGEQRRDLLRRHLFAHLMRHAIRRH